MTAPPAPPGAFAFVGTPPPPRPGGARRALGVVGVAAAAAAPVAAVLGLAAAASGDGETGGALLVLGGGGLALLGLVGTVTRYGPSGVLLALGVVALVSGAVAMAGLEVAGEAAETLYAGDDDGDGAVDEDGPGDADASERDATQVSGPTEVLDHEDDDADGSSNEDPPPIVVVVPETRALLALGAGAGAAVLAAGFVLLAAFFGVRGSRWGRSRA